MDSETTYLALLKRAGLVLLIIGCVDIAWMVYCITNEVAYSSSFNIFAVIAGVFMMRGSLRVAGWVRWWSLFILAGLSVALAFFPFVQPFDLTVTEASLSPRAFLVSFLVAILSAWLMYWLSQTLGSEPVQRARESAGMKRSGSRLPIALGLTLSIAVVVLTSLLLNSENSVRAKSIAKQQLGDDYRYHVGSLSTRSSADGTHVRATVTAWNHGEIRHIPVGWSDPKRP
ncbi:MAG: cytochrome d ubiquinol oxidase subunit II [Denitromonas halophila]|nr:MAG: cytochrome d ubiquinol oxidase subunit II [Denitromonas halophila]TVT65565.1 MAG: cytochrome d ubiquinol oxidase subunit II [Denitromonas halophila]TVT78646.1 MAG: cytochrome d ubiquinol oxidase subunit II [Denitromonas halophila]